MKLQTFAVSFLALLLFGDAAFSAEEHVNAGEPLKQAPDIVVISGRKEFDIPPKMIQGAAPIYPIRQLQLANSGKAVIEFTITANGNSRDFRVVLTSYKSFADHAILAVQQWRWRPAQKQGHPVAVRVRLPFTYVARSYGNTGNQVPY